MNTASTTITRREALARIALIMGGAVIGGDAYLRGSTPISKLTTASFNNTDIALLDEIGDTIIPATDTPGAKSVGIGAFMAMMVNDCYDDAHHAIFVAGLTRINVLSRERFSKEFTAITPEQRTTLLNELDAEQRQHHAARAKEDPVHFFRMMKQLTLLGYFTSEPGATQALRFIEVPGRYDGNAPYKKGDRNWFGGPSRYLDTRSAPPTPPTPRYNRQADSRG